MFLNNLNKLTSTFLRPLERRRITTKLFFAILLQTVFYEYRRKFLINLSNKFT